MKLKGIIKDYMMFWSHRFLNIFFNQILLHIMNLHLPSLSSLFKYADINMYHQAGICSLTCSPLIVDVPCILEWLHMYGILNPNHPLHLQPPSRPPTLLMVSPKIKHHQPNLKNRTAALLVSPSPLLMYFIKCVDCIKCNWDASV